MRALQPGRDARPAAADADGAGTHRHPARVAAGAASPATQRWRAAARERLRLGGMSERQIGEVERSGQVQERVAIVAPESAASSPN
ncbi:MAG: efflux RND transporter periplasmic adaptor subunit [Comamonadaceae bacterium]|nr:efflux RND transporter periplasmic adaptor subunit [Comamonadaceae bacterium]